MKGGHPSEPGCIKLPPMPAWMRWSIPRRFYRQNMLFSRPFWSPAASPGMSRCDRAFPEDLLAPTRSNRKRITMLMRASPGILSRSSGAAASPAHGLDFKGCIRWSMAEIADALGTTLSSVTSLMHRAR
jgi:hypothetical protein